jgi:hypothetical protein
MRVLLGASLLFFSGVASADDPANPTPAGGVATEPLKKMTLGADVVGVIPLGDYGKAASFAIGAEGRVEYYVTPKLNVTGHVGYLYHFGTLTNTSLSIIPIYVGATYEVMPKLFGWAELGISIISQSVDIMGVSASTNDNKFGFALGAGYEVAPKIKARAGFYVPGSQDMGGGSTTFYGVLLSVGYDFTQF